MPYTTARVVAAATSSICKPRVGAMRFTAAAHAGHDRLAVAIEEERDQHRQRELQQAVADDRAGLECELSNRIDEALELGEESHAVVRKGGPVGRGPLTDQRNATDPGGRIGRPALDQPPRELGHSYCVLGEGRADDHERRHHHHEDQYRHQRGGKRRPPRAASKPIEQRPRGRGKDRCPHDRGQEGLQNEVDAGDEDRQHDDRDGAVDSGRRWRAHRGGQPCGAIRV